MFYLKEPAELRRPWVLSRSSDPLPAVIPLEVVSIMRNYHIMPVEFMYHGHAKGLHGAILNQDSGMNFPLQIAAFYRAVLKEPSLVLVIAPESAVCSWHYHLTVYGGMKVIRVTEQNSATDFHEVLSTETSSVALLLEFGSLKTVEQMVDHDFFSVVVDDFDEVANKILFRKIAGSYNIGLSTRNFYRHPDQKIVWKMLNWSNPGCVGKLADFYEADNENFEYYRDNYRWWWHRQTWGFCESFRKPSDDEREELNQKLREWAKSHDLPRSSKSDKQPARKRKQAPSKPPSIVKRQKSPESDDISDVVESSQMKFSENIVKKAKAVNNISAEQENCVLPIAQDLLKSPQLKSDESSVDTIIYETQYLSSLDENPILTSIMMNIGSSPEPDQKPHSLEGDASSRPTSRCSAPSSDGGVILSIINEKRPRSAAETAEDFLVNLFTENPRSAQNPETNEANDFEEILKKADLLLGK